MHHNWDRNITSAVKYFKITSILIYIMILKFNEKLKSLHSTSKFVTNKILNIVYIFNSEQKKNVIII